ncbi:MAG: exodeoxyribonuclease III [Bacillota bacterium]|nr:exodeoxyribonuclease III [Bacillota bacterium]
MKILSWNVNGIRAIEKKGFRQWLLETDPDILAIQETKAHIEQLEDALIHINGYHSYFCSGQRKGYSGTALYTKVKPNLVEYGIGIERFDCEGRIIIAHYDDFILFNCYFPNGGASEERLQYKMDFYDACLDYFKAMRGKHIIICGDVNTAHQEIDLARPKENRNISGFLDIERAWITKMLEEGFIDTFRYFHPEEQKYSWWSYRFHARSRNAGWRLDYFFADPHMKSRLASAEILNEVEGSDHCPISLEIR